jgi:hypothetical protein
MIEPPIAAKPADPIPPTNAATRNTLVALPVICISPFQMVMQLPSERFSQHVNLFLNAIDV